jgi:hypothetical protein
MAPLVHPQRSDVAAFALLLCASTLAVASDDRTHYLTGGDLLWNATFLLEAQQGSRLSDKVDSVRGGGYESSSGNWIGFERWYSTKRRDIHLTWMTQLSPSWGLIWGVSTGERGDKYLIGSSAKIGFVYHAKLAQRSYLSVKATTIVGGRLKEKPCTADYGEVGGVHRVNCRLAASFLPPGETLQYLFDEKPFNKDAIFVQYTRHF